MASKRERQGEGDATASEPCPKQVKKTEDGAATPPAFAVDLTDSAFVNKMKEAYTSATPFPHMLEDLFNDAFLLQLQEEILDETWYPKCNDLYKFLQTNDLVNAKGKALQRLRNEVLLSDTFLNFMETLTSIKLDRENVDLTGSMYLPADRLLCHDDELDTRRIAFVIYLVPDSWGPRNGGALDLFEVDEHMESTTVVKSLMPRFGGMSMFAVTERSYHQVAEVLGRQERLSINGWFHGAPYPRPPPSLQKAPSFEPITGEGARPALSDWLHDTYLNDDAIKKVNSQLTESSSVELHSFLRAEKYDLMVKELSAATAEWKLHGPAHHARFFEPYPLPPTVSECLKLFKSAAFAAHLHRMSNLDLTRVAGSVRKFEQGCYTLVDDSSFQQPPELDVVLTIVPEKTEWTKDTGGVVLYLDSEEELQAVAPHANTLSVVYRDSACNRFVMYNTHNSPGTRMDISMVYREDEGKEGASGSEQDDASGSEQD